MSRDFSQPIIIGWQRDSEREAILFVNNIDTFISHRSHKNPFYETPFMIKLESSKTLHKSFSTFSM